HDHARVVPEAGAVRQRLRLEDVERGGQERAVVERPQDVLLDLQAAAPGVDEHRAAEAAVAGEAAEQRVVGDAAGLRRQRQEKDEDVRAGEEGGALRLAGEYL